MTSLSAFFAESMARFGPWEVAPRLAIAVSGGVDSLCLLQLATPWVQARGGQLIALTVEHGLRAEAAREAAELHRHLTTLGMEHHILPWQGAKPAAGIQQAARDARYRLLGLACRKQNLLHLLIAHHADDQQETLTLRQRRGSTAWGMAGMPEERMLPHCRLLRPLLGIPKSELIGWMRQEGHPWWEDASNQQPHYARNRLRQQPLPAQNNHSALENRQEETRILATIALQLEYGPDAAVHIPPSAWQHAAALQERLLSRLLQQLTGSPHPPRRESLQAVLPQMEQGWTLHGIQCRPWQKGYLLHREPAAVIRHLSLLQAGYPLSDHFWQPLGPRVEAYRRHLRESGARGRDWPISRLAALPAMLDGNGAFITILDTKTVWQPRHGLAEWQSFLPFGD